MRTNNNTWERQSKRREGVIGVVRSARQKVAREREELIISPGFAPGFAVITSPGFAPFNEIFFWDTERKCGLDDVGGVGFRLEKEATARSKPGRTLEMSEIIEYISNILYLFCYIDLWQFHGLRRLFARCVSFIHKIDVCRQLCHVLKT